MLIAKSISLYEQLEQLPESLTGQILNGQLYTHPRPNGKHILISSNVGAELHGPFQKGKNGPGGWWILQEPEVHLTLNSEVVVPDLAGWKKERLPEIPDTHKFTVIPDWICEIFSPSTESIDKEIKMPLYAKYGVKYLWLIHPIKKSLQAFKLTNNEWILQGTFEGNDAISIEPFDSINIKLNDLME